MTDLTAVETLLSRAKFADSRGSHDFAARLRRVADLGEKASQFEIDETRAVGKAIVIRADLKAALDEFLEDFAKEPGISWDEAIEVLEAKIAELRAVAETDRGRDHPAPYIASVFYFPNGNVAVCDQFGQQMPEYQGGTGKEMQPIIDAHVAMQRVKPVIKGSP